MGVPAFFRWLSRKYPTIVVNAVEEHRSLDGTQVPVDATQPNPNFQEFDNLYLDMNGIIHPCTHPEDCPAPKNEEEMFQLIFEYIDRLFAIVRPRRVLYMAIDGVAPRAKMNQQRSRRFRASKEAAEKQEEILSIRNRLEGEGIPLPPPKAKEEHFDSNCITPGTPFMARLAVALRYYVHLRITNDPAWHNLEVILSDANAPGEGEHKIMDFIRPDADLIMLGLATHEVNFNILREEFVPNQPRPCELCLQFGHELKDCQGLLSSNDNPDKEEPAAKHTNFIFIRLPILREYLERDLQMPNLPFPYDLERAIDDWVFMCFFNGNVHTDRVELIMKELGKVEDEIFRNRQDRELRFRANQKRRRLQENRTQRPAFLPQSSSIIAPQTPKDAKNQQVSGEEARRQMADQRREGMKLLDSLFTPAGTKRSLEASDEEAPKASLESEWRQTPENADRMLKILSFKAAGGQSAEPWREVKRDAKALDTTTEDDADSEPEDTIRLWEDGWKERYYRQKFNTSETDIEFRRKVAWAYTEGLCWVLKYYYQGCVSWDWYYPYHYAPFASDFDNISEYTPDFSKPTQPFNPLEQLMSVFPAASRSHIPAGWRELMTSKESPIFDFYPTDFKIDLNGKKFAWQGVALLPFVDEKLLLETLKSVYHTLTEDEKARNVIGPDRLFVGKRHKLYDSLVEVYQKGKEDEENKKGQGATQPEWIYIDPQLAYGMSGQVCYDCTAVAPGQRYRTLFPGSDRYTDVEVNNCIMVAYKEPDFPDGHVFAATRLQKATTPERTLRPQDWNERRNGPYKPMIGFSRNVPQASLDQSGHRTIRHELSINQHSSRGRDAPYHRPQDPRRYQSDNWQDNRQDYRQDDQRTYYNRNYRQPNDRPNRAHAGRDYYQQPNAPYSQPPPPMPPQMPSFQQLALYGNAPSGLYGPPPVPPQFGNQRGRNGPPHPPPGQHQYQQHGAGDPRRPQQQPLARVPTNLYGAPNQNNQNAYGGYQGFFG
ncbi:putative 5-3 exonuclease domain containing protein [Aphelenchoides fujianensis]|nr:putative 5-3 exonuclease domain containing protein [Aphelenchoides fujianensis]